MKTLTITSYNYGNNVLPTLRTYTETWGNVKVLTKGRSVIVTPSDVVARAGEICVINQNA